MLIIRVITFEIRSNPTYMTTVRYLNVTDGRTDSQTTVALQLPSLALYTCIAR